MALCVILVAFGDLGDSFLISEDFVIEHEIVIGGAIVMGLPWETLNPGTAPCGG